ncbi:unnamed protein product [Fusarium graminearum]|uniref:Uncharacterized protein n=1 Tax=Gibberella zeae TaxID=5518 RepID=A0A9N8NJ49_GIBZA|nr:unnamed protein product [Fusarium graminearum]
MSQFPSHHVYAVNLDQKTMRVGESGKEAHVIAPVTARGCDNQVAGQTQTQTQTYACTESANATGYIQARPRATAQVEASDKTPSISTSTCHSYKLQVTIQLRACQTFLLICFQKPRDNCPSLMIRFSLHSSFYS